MAQKTETKTTNKLWWVVPAVAASVIAAVVFPYLHIRYGSTTPLKAAGTGIANLGVFLASYSYFRRVNMTHSSSSFIGLLVSILVALPVFVIAFIGLGFEIPELADIGAMYILGTWIGSSEAAEKAHHEE